MPPALSRSVEPEITASVPASALELRNFCAPDSETSLHFDRTLKRSAGDVGIVNRPAVSAELKVCAPFPGRCAVRSSENGLPGA